MLSISAKLKQVRIVDPNKYKWYIYNGRNLKFTRESGINRKHDLVLNTGDMYGHYLTKTHLTHKLVLPGALHIEYAPDDKTMKKILKESVPAKTVPSATQVKRTSTRKKPQFYFKPKHAVTGEKQQIDKANYQWRRSSSAEPLALKDHAGKLRPVKITWNQVFGLRFINKAKGGILLLDRIFKAIRIPTSTYDDLVYGSELLPVQPTGIVSLKELAVPKIKVVEKTKPLVSKPPREEIEEEPVKKRNRVLKVRVGKGVKRSIPDSKIEDDLDEENQVKRKHSQVRRVGKTKRQEAEEIEEQLDQIQEDLDDVPDTENVDQEDQMDEDHDWDEDDDFVVGDIITFHKDKQEREYIILDKKPDSKSEDYTLYKIYNLDDEPEYIQTFRLSHADNSTRLSKLAQLLRKATRKDLAKYLKYLDFYKVSTKSPYK